MKERCKKKKRLWSSVSTVRKRTRPSWRSRGTGKQKRAISRTWQVSCRVPVCMLFDSGTHFELKWNSRFFTSLMWVFLYFSLSAMCIIFPWMPVNVIIVGYPLFIILRAQTRRMLNTLSDFWVTEPPPQKEKKLEKCFNHYFCLTSQYFLCIAVNFSVSPHNNGTFHLTNSKRLSCTLTQLRSSGETQMNSHVPCACRWYQAVARVGWTAVEQGLTFVEPQKEFLLRHI